MRRVVRVERGLMRDMHMHVDDDNDGVEATPHRIRVRMQNRAGESPSHNIVGVTYAARNRAACVRRRSTGLLLQCYRVRGAFFRHCTALLSCLTVHV